ncbi:MAG: iron ABC transporter permease [Bryobacterales bacterium]|nr:iron ABC transporter permease [Bryobacteraceae bacterium]MDW8355200.1 iron ABC transporter permease [Bryobacterales bacterium]
MGPVLMDRGKPARSLALSGFLFVLAGLLSPWFGPSDLDLRRAFAQAGPERAILLELRLPRTLLGLLVGGCLGVAGAVFQALLRESLATPYTLGVASGAAFAVATATVLGATEWAGLPVTWLAAWAGAAAVTGAVALLGRAGGQLSSLRMLLAGISLNAIFSAATLTMVGAAREHRAMTITQWLIGSIEAVRPVAIVSLAAVAAASLAVLLAQARALNLMAVGEDWAATRGIRPARVLAAGLAAGSLLTAAAVSLAGPIGFVGLLVPHLARRLISADHRLLLPCSFLGGGALLALADTIARTVTAPAELPTGAVMAFIGGPYLIWSIWRRF